MNKVCLAFVFFSVVFSSSAQEDGNEDLDALFRVDYDTPLTIDLEEEEVVEDVAPRVRKRRNFYFGVKTKKHYTRTGFGREAVYELFNFLKEYEGPPPYAQDFYWYNTRTKRIVNSLNVDENRAYVLHGPYRKMLGEQVLEEGWFYKGQKHQRWVRYNSSDILQDKSYWWKGWPRDSRLSYYDFDREKLKEVIPIHFGEKEGEYWAFHSNGELAARGVFLHDYKIGVWREYYDNGRVKREVQYPENPFDFQFDPIILREWSRDGQLIYDREEFQSSLR